MAETIASLAVKIGADLTGLSSGLQQAQGKLKSVSDKLGQIGKRLTMTVTAPLVGLGVAVTKMAIEWESAFAGVEKTVDGTAEQMAALEDQLLRTSRQMPISPEQIAKIAELGGQLGVGIQDIDAFTRVIAKLGVSTDLSTEQAAMGMARFINITKRVAPEGATFIEQTNAIGATIVDLGNNFAATESEIMEFAGRIAGAGSVVGLSQEEILGWSAALASMGLRAEAGGTAISRIFLDIQKAVAAGGDELKLLAKVTGVSIDEFSALMAKDASGAAAAFIDGIRRMQDSGENFLPILDALGFGNVRVRDTILRLAGSGEILDEALGAAGESFENVTALNIEAAKRFKTTESQIRIIRNTFHYLGVVIGKQVLPVIIDMLGKVGPLVEKFADFVKVNPDIIKFGLGVAAVAAAIGPLAMGLGIVLPLIGALFSPLGLAFIGVVALAAGFVKAKEGIVPAIEAIIDKVKAIAKAVMAGDWSAVWEELKGIGATIVGIVGGWVDIAKQKVSEKWEEFKALVAGKWATLKDVFTSEGWVAAIETALSFVGITVDFSELIDNIRPKWNAVAMIFKEKGLIEAVETALLFAGVIVDFSAIGTKIAAAWEKMWLGTWEKTGEEIRVGDEFLPVIEQVGGLKSKIEEVASAVWAAFAEKFPKSAALAEEVFGALYAKVDELIGKLRELATVVGEELPESMEAGIITTIRDLFNLQMDNAYDRVESLKGILEAGEEIFTSIGELMGIVGNNTEGWNTALDSLNQWLPDILDWLTPWDNILASLKGHLDNIATGLGIVIRLRDEFRQGFEDGEGGRISSFQQGGIVGRGGLALVGEAGPELAWLPRATQVIPAAETREMLSPQGQSQISFVQNFYGQVDAVQAGNAAHEGILAAMRAGGMN